MKKCKRFIVWCLLMVMLTGCTQSAVGLDLSEVKTDPERLVWGSFSDVDVSLGDVGLFYPKNNTLRYYDMETREEYILCPRANCMHNSKECIAYFPSNLFGQSADGVAQIDNYIYCVYNGITIDDYAENTAKSIQLLRIDLNRGIREAVASFPCAMILTDGADQTFYADGISETNYCNGWAWFYLSMKQHYGLEEQLEYTQLTGVNLETGEVVALNGYDDYDYYSFVMITSQRVYYRAIRELVERITQEEWYDRFGDGAGTVEGITFESYSDYWMWHANETGEEYSYYYYDIQTGETTELLTAETVTENTSWVHQANIWSIEGEWEGRVLFSELQPDEDGEYSGDHTAYYLYDPQTGETEWIDAMADGQALSIAASAKPNPVFPDGSFFYIRYVGEDRCDIYTYNFSTGEETFLFNDDSKVTFRIFGEYKDGFFGEHADHQYQEGCYWISKEDFFAGNLDAMIHYDAG